MTEEGASSKGDAPAVTRSTSEAEQVDRVKELERQSRRMMITLSAGLTGLVIVVAVLLNFGRGTSGSQIQSLVGSEVDLFRQQLRGEVERRLERVTLSTDARIAGVEQSVEQVLEQFNNAMVMLQSEQDAHVAFELRPGLRLECEVSAAPEDTERDVALFLRKLRSELQRRGIGAETLPEASGRIVLEGRSLGEGDQRRPEMHGWVAMHDTITQPGEPLVIGVRIEFVTISQATFRDASKVKRAAGEAFLEVVEAARLAARDSNIAVVFPPADDKAGPDGSN